MTEPRTGLYVIATPIGNREEISPRVGQILAQVDLLICEEEKSGLRLLKWLNLQKPIALLNEHNEKKAPKELADRIIMEGLTAALISDAGTPAIADPGAMLVARLEKYNVAVRPVAGPCSITAALSVAGIKIESFLYRGFLPAQKEERRLEIQKLQNQLKQPVVILDTPYRLKPLLTDLVAIIGENHPAFLAYKLTQPEEKLWHGTLGELLTMSQGLAKGEFVLILKPRRPSRRFGDKREGERFDSERGERDRSERDRGDKNKSVKPRERKKA